MGMIDNGKMASEQRIEPYQARLRQGFARYSEEVSEEV